MDNQMPRIGLGTWELEGDDATRSVASALDMGYRHIDTAQAYGNERQVGKGLAQAGVDRGDLWLTTKIWNSKLAPDDVVASTEKSLERLGTEYLDLLLIHWPAEIDMLEQTLEAMQGLADRGLTRNLGVSNFSSTQVRRAAEVADILTNQVEYHALLDQSAVREALQDVGGVLTAYSPLARGKLLEDPVVVNVAGARGVHPAQVALRWLLDQEDVVVIPKSTSDAHLRSNLAVIDMQPLQPEDTSALNQLRKDERIIDPPFAPDWD